MFNQNQLNTVEYSVPLQHVLRGSDSVLYVNCSLTGRRGYNNWWIQSLCLFMFIYVILFCLWHKYIWLSSATSTFHICYSGSGLNWKGWRSRPNSAGVKPPWNFSLIILFSFPWGLKPKSSLSSETLKAACQLITALIRSIKHIHIHIVPVGKPEPLNWSYKPEKAHILIPANPHTHTHTLLCTEITNSANIQ